MSFLINVWGFLGAALMGFTLGYVLDCLMQHRIKPKLKQWINGQ